MSKVPNFYKFRSSGTSIVTNECTNEHRFWHLHLVDCLVPEDGGFSITFRVNKLIETLHNNYGLMISMIDRPENVDDLYRYDDTSAPNNTVNSGKFSGIGWFALSGIIFVYNENNINTEKYGKGDEIKINIYKNKTIEFFKNNQSMKIFNLNSFDVIPSVSFASTSEVEIINISSLDDDEAQQSNTINNNDNNNNNNKLIQLKQNIGNNDINNQK
eukprot:TRINITY_DN727_c0_g2_i2.p1 TRINITY_DN727_c0_g2~~TRINITY_DN727_c0_g2_i2.p1  ORF type:complete len:215 (+),score=44.82 TRINITY_DN727_c0_g2_i2:119-763(+)